jgi:hypothetical protein
MIQGTDNVYTINEAFPGMDLRTHMAIQFMAARLPLFCQHSALDETYADHCAEESLIAVDALLKALNKPTGNP